ncbi:MAG: glycosyltransferase [Chitinophagaceae bacterium]|jgi:glycosyltransferase involved in cell wall biosynthesis|nr:glycosyltransferase [Chitinophagaceae bacterium]
MNTRIIDTYSKNGAHEAFNAPVVSMAASFSDTVDYFCDKTTQDAVIKMLTNHNQQRCLQKVTFHNVNVKEGGKRKGIFYMLYMYSVRLFKDVYYLLSAPKNTLTVYSGAGYATALWILNCVSFIFRKRVWIFIHGELEFMLKTPSKNKRFSEIGMLYRRVLYRGFLRYVRINKNMRLCVLGNSILNNLQPYLNSKNKKRVTSINDPIFFNERKSSIRYNEKLKIGTVGTMDNGKGLAELLDVAEKLKDEITITIVGNIKELDFNYALYSHINFISKNNKQFIPRDVMDKAIDKLDYILFLYPPDSYKLIASGAMFDAIIMEKPVISLHNDFFDDILKPDIGYLLNTAGEIAALIRKLNKEYPHNPDYEKFLNNMEEIKSRHTPAFVQEMWKANLETWN